MSDDNKDELEELLKLAQETKALSKNLYDYSKSSVDNYVRMNKFRHVMDAQFLNRVPSSLLFMDYQEWMKKNYPEILAETDRSFYKIAKDQFNRYLFKGITYNLIRVPKRFRKYKHPHNVKYHEYMKMLWRTRKKAYYAQKKENDRKKPFVK